MLACRGGTVTNPVNMLAIQRAARRCAALADDDAQPFDRPCLVAKLVSRAASVQARRTRAGMMRRLDALAILIDVYEVWHHPHDPVDAIG